MEIFPFFHLRVRSFFESCAPNLIFVHGLRGGSRKTWCYDPDDASTFWPQEWLPYEPGFKNVRIHSFGYDSDWSQRQESPLTIFDFSQALLSDILTSPHLGKSQTPIVFVAHSMGGLVVKKAYLQARSDQLYTKIAERTESIFFLGTCHRGSNATVYLETFLSLNLLWNTKAYVRELLPDSQTVREINTEFRHVCESVNLWSFWESKTTSGVFIVEKSSAVLDVPREHVHYLPSDHRHLCKFSTPEDPSYVILRQSLLSTMKEIESGDASRQKANYADDMLLISKALGVAEAPAREFSAAVSRIHQGSCTWLTENDVFRDWISFAGYANDNGDNPSETNPDDKTRLIWLNGPPGTGKSVSASYVIQFLQQRNLDCSYFFIKSNAVAPLTQLLLSLAFQMAESNHAARQACLAVIEKGTAGFEDPNAIWSSLFVDKLLKLAFRQPHFWVVDGLDELPLKPLSSLVQMLAKIEASIPLHLFITSRLHVPIQIRFREEGKTWAELHTGQAESMGDITAFVDSKIKFKLDDESQREELTSDIVKRSEGNFLWASIVVDRLDTAYSVEDMKDALQQAPSEMTGIYEKVLETIKQSASASLAKCILEWVVCSPRPLKAGELRKIVFLDIKRTLVARPTAPNAIFSVICGNFVTVDPQGYVQIMHQTAKEFLTSGDSDFYVDQRAAHEAHAAVCLTHINLEISSSRQTRRRPTGAALSRQDNSVFDEYAHDNFSYHLAHSNSMDPGLLRLLELFFDGGVLVWVERVVRTGKLGPILTAVENLKPYVFQQHSEDPSSGSQHNQVKEWLIDLSRLVTVFGQKLLDSPTSIHLIIPPLCPTSSMLYKTFAKQSRRRLICGSNDRWGELVATLGFGSLVNAISATDQYVAVGLTNRTIRIFDQSTLETITTLSHDDSSSCMDVAWGNVTSALASMSHGMLFLWNSNLTLRWKTKLRVQHRYNRGLCFSPDDDWIYVPHRHTEDTVLAFRASDGCEAAAFGAGEYNFNAEADSEAMCNSSSSDSGDSRSGQVRPYLVRLSPTLGLAVVAYPGAPITILTLDGREGLNKLTTFEKPGHGLHPPEILDIAFGPAIDADRMAVAYGDGDIVTVEIGNRSARERNSCKLLARRLASSPDGRILAATDGRDNIWLCSFDTLQILHRISPTYYMRGDGLTFSSDSLRLFNTDWDSCQVWEPPIPMHHNLLDDTSLGPAEPKFEVSIAAPETPGYRPSDGTSEITAMTTGGSAEVILCGYADGSLVVRSLTNGGVLLRENIHQRHIHRLAWHSKSSILLSVDVGGNFARRRFACSPSGPELGEGMPTDLASQGSDFDVLIRDGSSTFSALLSSIGTNGGYWERYDKLLKNGGHFSGNRIQEFGVSRWLQDPTDADRLLLIQDDRLHIFHWDGLQRETQEHGILFAVPDGCEPAPEPYDWDSQLGTGFLVQAQTSTTRSVTRFWVVDVSQVEPSLSSVPPFTTDFFGTFLFRILAIHHSDIYFVSYDSWICAISMECLTPRENGPAVTENEPASPGKHPTDEGTPRISMGWKGKGVAGTETRPSLNSSSGGSSSKMKSGAFYTRYFFLPPWREPITGRRQIEVLPEKNCVVTAERGELMIFHGFLDGGERVEISRVPVSD